MESLFHSSLYGVVDLFEVFSLKKLFFSWVLVTKFGNFLFTLCKGGLAFVFRKKRQLSRFLGLERFIYVHFKYQKMLFHE
ncbi:hypothetical protein Gasu2_13100 [Galdieria sulphuraria]|nr:hypothetical protein Gasu2_13100 [Galdieria sulphuraria]